MYRNKKSVNKCDLVDDDGCVVVREKVGIEKDNLLEHPDSSLDTKMPGDLEHG